MKASLAGPVSRALAAGRAGVGQAVRPARLPAVHEVASFEEWAGRAAIDRQRIHPRRAVRCRAGHRSDSRLSRARRAGPGLPGLGPEGGWTPEERDRAIRAGVPPVTLGPLTLRADAVPLAARGHAAGYLGGMTK